MKSGGLESKKIWSLRKKITFTGIFFLFSLFLSVGSVLVLDLFLHKKFDEIGALNYRGYRGPVIGGKESNELRVAVLGGSTAYGYGVKPTESFPYFLESKLNALSSSSGISHVRVFNLAYNNEGAFSFLPTLQDFEYLGIDVVILYEGYNDLGRNTSVFRHTSYLFKKLGYMAIFPTIFAEKAMSIRHGGDLEGAYWGKKTVFKPNLADQTKATVLEAAAKVSRALEAQLSQLAEEKAKEPEQPNMECGRWFEYCGSVKKAIDYALTKGKNVIVVGQPYVHPVHTEQQTALRAMLAKTFKNQERVQYVDLANAVNTKDLTLAFDGGHLYPKGNEKIASSLVDPTLSQLKSKAGGKVSRR